jgi:hypothetical protein
VPDKLSQTEKRRIRKIQSDNKGRFRRWFGLFGLGSLSLIIIAGLIVPNLPFGGNSDTKLIGPGINYEIQGREHFSSGEFAESGYYNSNPPTSGKHALNWVECGIHDIQIQDEVHVKNLENGYVIINYDSNDKDLQSELENIVTDLPSWPNQYILSPRDNMNSLIALTAWGVLLELSEIDFSAMEEFSSWYRGLGPESNAPICEAGGKI